MADQTGARYVVGESTRQAKEGYLQGQIGNPDGEDKPNKKFYDPRVWIRKVSNTRSQLKFMLGFISLRKLGF